MLNMTHIKSEVLGPLALENPLVDTLRRVQGADEAHGKVPAIREVPENVPVMVEVLATEKVPEKAFVMVNALGARETLASAKERKEEALGLT